MKKAVLVTLVVLLLVCVPGCAFTGGMNNAAAALVVVQPMWTYINYVSCTVSITSSGLAQMSSTMDCDPAITKIRMAQYLQRYNDGWENVNSWQQYYYGSTADWDHYYYVVSGYQYRLYVFFYAYINNTVTESTSRISYYSYY